MAEEDEEEKTNLLRIVDVVWEDRYFSQITKFHVIAVLLVSVNHNVLVIGTFTKQTFASMMHRFLTEYFDSSNAGLAMKQWLAFRDKERDFHTNAKC